MIPIDYFAEARADYDESFCWYAERSQRAASNFANAIDDALIRIATSPDQFPLIDTVHRECLVRRFPFRIVFRIEDDRVLVVAVAHAKRRPGYWRHRT